MTDPIDDSPEKHDFIRALVREDLRTGKYGGRVVTRFPPEPNGYLHIGHAKSICLNFGVAKELGGRCHLRMDDTNPTTEDPEYVASIQGDVSWLGFGWGEHLYYASDWFDKMYECAEQLIRLGHAYVCSLSAEEFDSYRGTITEPGRPSPYRSRSAEENLELFRRMRAGEFADGQHVLRGKIDMSAANMKLRDPPLYRIRRAHHYRQGDKWCIYPLYDFAHCLEDAFEGVTHSFCTLEFENNRDLYDWVLESLPAELFPTQPRPEQNEFARLNLTYTVMSKRKLLQLVQGKLVNGWDDPRMPTIAGLRRRGVTPEAVRRFCDRIGVSKNNSTVELALLEHTIREDLNTRAPRVLAVLDPLPLTLVGAVGAAPIADAPHWPEDVLELLGGQAPEPASRSLPFSSELVIDRSDFAEEPPKGWHRLAPGRAVRLRHGPVVRCVDVLRDGSGAVAGLRCELVEAGSPEAVAVKGTIQWVSRAEALPCEVRLYDRLFTVESPGEDGRDFLTELNPQSLVVAGQALVEPSLRDAKPGERFQLERLGYFVVDPDSTAERLVLNRTVSLKDGWSRQQAGTADKAERVERKREEKAKQAPPPTLVLSEPALALRDAHGLSDSEAHRLSVDAPLRGLFEQGLAVHGKARSLASWLVNELGGLLPEGGVDALPVTAQALAALVKLVDDGTITAPVGKQLLAELVSVGGDPVALVESRGLRQIGDESALTPILERVLAAEAQLVTRYRGGNKNLLGALVGKVMKETGGKASPKLVGELLERLLG